MDDLNLYNWVALLDQNPVFVLFWLNNLWMHTANNYEVLAEYKMVVLTKIIMMVQLPTST